MLINRSIQIPVFLRIGRELLGNLPSLLGEHHLSFRSALVVASPRSEALARGRIAHSFDSVACLVVERSDHRRVGEVRAAAREGRAELVVGIGGGTALDVAKYAASRERLSYLAIPTAPSNDGIASPIAVIRGAESFESLPARMPIGVVADLDVLREAPPACARAGIGDLLANLSAVADWDLACRRGRDRPDDFARLLALSGAEAMLRYADHDDADPRSLELLETLMNGLVLSGVAMEIAGSSRPCSGAEHLFSHALDRIAARPAMHGTQVGIGTLLMSLLRGDDWEALKSTMTRLGLTLRAADAGIGDTEIVEGLVRARETRPDRYTLLDEIAVTEERAAEVARQAGVC